MGRQDTDRRPADRGDDHVLRRAAIEPIELTCPRPVGRPVMLQGWHDLASIHWPFEPDVVQRILPSGLTVDVCDGQAWVGLIPFQMRRIRLPGLPALGPWSSFPETNVRTYVVAPDGRRAVWFCSLDVTRIVPAAVARIAYGLPYCWADMSITRLGPHLIEYTARRRWPHTGPSSRAVIEVGPRLAADDISEVERFVTARWSLASTFARRSAWADIDHEPWPLHRARLVECDDSLVADAGIPRPDGEPVVLWSPGVEVRIGRPRIRRGGRSRPPGGGRPSARRRSEVGRAEADEWVRRGGSGASTPSSRGPGGAG